MITIVVPLSISNLQQGRHNFLSTSQIVTKIGGGVSHVQMALEPRPHTQENSESRATLVAVCFFCGRAGHIEKSVISKVHF